MVLSVSPGDKDDSSKLTILKIHSSKGQITTPMRTINRNDVSAKDAIGSNIHLAKTAKSFFYEVPLNVNDVINILNDAKNFDKFEKKIFDMMDRFSNSGVLFFLYFSLTNEAYADIILKDWIKLYVHRICDFTNEIGLECVILPTFNKIKTVAEVVQKHDLQFIPKINLKNDFSLVEKEMDEFEKFDCSNSPLLAINFCTYLDAKDQYKKIIKKFDDWHERNKAILTMGAERKLQSCDNVSGIHYPAVIYGDLIAEKFGRFFGDTDNKNKKKTKLLDNANNLRWFDRNGLQFSRIQEVDVDSFLESRKSGIYGNSATRGLLIRIATNQLTLDDIKNRRANALNRIDENDLSRPEFEVFQKHISNREVTFYKNSKKELNDVLKKHFSS